MRTALVTSKTGAVARRDGSRHSGGQGLVYCGGRRPRHRQVDGPCGPRRCVDRRDAALIGFTAVGELRGLMEGNRIWEAPRGRRHAIYRHFGDTWHANRN
jgi:hypothetical protein